MLAMTLSTELSIFEITLCFKRNLNLLVFKFKNYFTMGTIVYPAGCGSYPKRPICLYSYSTYTQTLGFLTECSLACEVKIRFRMRRFIGQDNEEVLDLPEPP